MKLVLNYYNNQGFATNAQEAIDFINSLKGITANPSVIRDLESLFNGTNSGWVNALKRGQTEMATTGCGNSRIYCLRSLGLTLEAHNAVVEQNKIDRQKAKENRFQEKMNEMYEVKKGWYVVNLDCQEIDIKRGGSKFRSTNWRIMAHSEMNAYNQAVELASDKGFFAFADAERSQIDYIGEWNDVIEEIYSSAS